MQRVEIRIDVTEAAGLGETIELAATYSLPDPEAMPERPVAIFAAPGGGYSRAYYFLSFDGREGYDEAEYHAGRGLIHVAVDPVGVGASTIPDLSRIGFETLAATHDAFVGEIANRLENGTLHDGFPTCPDLFKVGMGQSMGGGISILTQGRHATFDAIAPCGVSAIHTMLPQRSKAATERGAARFAGVGGRLSHLTVDHEGVDYLYPFHWEDVPEDIVDLDMRGGYPIRETAPEFGSLTIPHCAVQMMVPGCFRDDAARIAVPVLIANGERDTCSDPHREPAAYRSSPDVSVFIVPTMAHMHNFASTRARLWQRLHDWSRLVAGAAS